MNAGYTVHRTDPVNLALREKVEQDLEKRYSPEQDHLAKPGQ
jgi:hypothetical protein